MQRVLALGGDGKARGSRVEHVSFAVGALVVTALHAVHITLVVRVLLFPLSLVFSITE